MEVWHFWLIAGLILVIAEIFSLTFYLIIFAVGAFLGALLALFNFSIYAQITLVAFFTGALAPFLPKILQKKFGAKGRSSLMAGEEGMLIGKIVKNPQGGWRVNYQGDTFPYEFTDANNKFELSENKEIVITKFQGITAIIAEKK